MRADLFLDTTDSLCNLLREFVLLIIARRCYDGAHALSELPVRLEVLASDSLVRDYRVDSNIQLVHTFSKSIGLRADTCAPKGFRF